MGNIDKTRVAMSAEQLAGLDLLIAAKQENPDFTVGETDVQLVATPVLQVALQTATATDATVNDDRLVAAQTALGADVKDPLIRAQLHEAARNVSLDTLIDLRNRALLKE